jgi:hypothetical protein
MSQTKIDKNLAIEQLWRRGALSFLLDSNQKSLYELFHNNPKKIQTWLLARRSGKTHSLCVLAIEYCLKHPGSIIKYVAPTKMQVERFIRPIITDILERGCPKDIKPEFNKKESIYFFTNGSELQLCGAEAGNIDSVRGGFSHISIIDEAQDVSNLNYAVKSVLYPTTVTTKGKILLSGTPPQDVDHEFISYIEAAEADGTLIKRTIYDNPRLSKEDIQEVIDTYKGVQNEEFRREFLCEIIKSSNNSVIPEFDTQKEINIVRAIKSPPHYNSFVSMDLGFRDMTVVLFGYYDFKNDKVVIQDEIVTHGSEMHLYTLGKQIKAKEEELWTNPITNEFVKPKKRVSDHDLIAINEITKATNYTVIFQPADKTNMLAGINFLRTLIGTERIIIDPKCKVLVRHLKNGKWATTAKDNLGRGGDGSHYDAIPALSYFLRAIDFNKNPYPADYNSPLRPDDAFFTPEYEQKKLDNVDVYKKMMNLKQHKEESKHAYYKILSGNREKK